MGIFLRFSRYLSILYQQKKTVHIPQRFNLNLLIASGLKIKKIPNRLLAAIKGKMVAKCKNAVPR